MRIFLDTANIDEIRQGVRWGVVHGITTNPSLVAKEGTNFRDRVLEICDIVDGPVSAEVTATDAEGMIEQGEGHQYLAPERGGEDPHHSRRLDRHQGAYGSPRPRYDQRNADLLSESGLARRLSRRHLRQPLPGDASTTSHTMAWRSSATWLRYSGCRASRAISSRPASARRCTSFARPSVVRTSSRCRSRCWSR